MNWYLIYTKPREEIRAKRNLEQQEYDVYLPMMPDSATMGARNGRRMPMFPRYIFLGLDEQHRDISGVRSTQGVVDFVRFGANLPTVPEQIMTSVRASEEHFTHKRNDARDALGKHQSVLENQPTDYRFIDRKSSERVALLINSLDEEAAPRHSGLAT